MPYKCEDIGSRTRHMHATRPLVGQESGRLTRSRGAVFIHHQAWSGRSSQRVLHDEATAFSRGQTILSYMLSSFYHQFNTQIECKLLLLSALLNGYELSAFAPEVDSSSRIFCKSHLCSTATAGREFWGILCTLRFSHHVGVPWCHAIDCTHGCTLNV